MSTVMLNVELVEQKRRELGISRKNLSKHVGLSKSFGYAMWKNGTLPQELPRQRKVLQKLSEKLGVEVDQLLLRLEAKTA